MEGVILHWFYLRGLDPGGANVPVMYNANAKSLGTSIMSLLCVLEGQLQLIVTLSEIPRIFWETLNWTSMHGDFVVRFKGG